MAFLQTRGGLINLNIDSIDTKVSIGIRSILAWWDWLILFYTSRILIEFPQRVHASAAALQICLCKQCTPLSLSLSDAHSGTLCTSPSLLCWAAASQITERPVCDGGKKEKRCGHCSLQLITLPHVMCAGKSFDTLLLTLWMYLCCNMLTLLQYIHIFDTLLLFSLFALVTFFLNTWV